MIDLAVAVLRAVLALVWLLGLTMLMIWVERKESAVIQDRIGANRASIAGFRALGLFQPFADALKMVFKEDFRPPFSRRTLHALAPFVSFFFTAVVVAAVPFGDAITLGGRRVALQAADLDAGLLFILAMLSLGSYGVLLGGWASNNRYSLLGGMRGAAQIISYEVALGLSLVGLVMVYPSLRLSAVVEAQGGLLFGFLPKWGVVTQPLGLAVFFVAALAETKRVPFDLPEGESEIIGFFTEYGGLKWGLYMMTDFVEVILVSALLTTFYFGGWQVPWLGPDGFHLPGGASWLLPRAAVVALQVLAFNLKVAFFCWLQVLLRWTLPRLRYDQLMAFGWKVLVPLGALNILATGAVLSVVRR